MAVSSLAAVVSALAAMTTAGAGIWRPPVPIPAIKIIVAGPSGTPSAPGVSTSSPTGVSGTPSPPPALSTYAAVAPGSLCDTHGGQWTVQGLDQVLCPTQTGTQLVINQGGQRGYLQLQQLPRGGTFASNNTISVAGTLGSPGNGYQAKCLGLAEETATSGYLAEYCNSGQWAVFSMVGGGGINQPPIARNVTNGLTTATVTLATQGSTLTLSVNGAVMGTASITHFQPTEVAIVYDCLGYGASQTIGGNALLVNNFSYAGQP